MRQPKRGKYAALTQFQKTLACQYVHLKHAGQVNPLCAQENPNHPALPGRVGSHELTPGSNEGFSSPENQPEAVRQVDLVVPEALVPSVVVKSKML